MNYYFLSIADVHTGKNIGCCVIQTENELNSPEEFNEQLLARKLMPTVCNNIQAYGMDEQGFQEQGMELDRLYSPQEMREMGF